MELPDDVFVGGDFENFGFALEIADEGVAVGEALGGAQVVEVKIGGEIGLSQGPDDLGVVVEFIDFGAVAASDEGVAVGQTEAAVDTGVFSWRGDEGLEGFAIGVEFADNGVGAVSDEVGAGVGFPREAELFVRDLGGLEFDFVGDGEVAVDFEKAFGAAFADEDAVTGERLAGVNFDAGAGLVLPRGGAGGGVDFADAAGVAGENAAIGKEPTVFAFYANGIFASDVAIGRDFENFSLDGSVDKNRVGDTGGGDYTHGEGGGRGGGRRRGRGGGAGWDG